MKRASSEVSGTCCRKISDVVGRGSLPSGGAEGSARDFGGNVVRIRHRPGQAVAIALLSALVTTCAAFAPLYDRAMQQALVDIDLARSTVAVTGLQLTSTAIPASTFGPPGRVRPLDTGDLLAMVPDRLRASYGEPVRGFSADAVKAPGQPWEGQLVWRGSQCEHVGFVRGRCPAAAGEVAVSGADARIFGLEPGARVAVKALPDVSAVHVAARTTELRVVGVYRQEPGDYWFGLVLTGLSGTINPEPPPGQVRHDVWLTDRSTFTSRRIPPLSNQSSAVALVLDRDRAGVDEVLALDAAIGRLKDSAPAAGRGTFVTVRSGLADLAKDVRAQRSQSRVTVPLLLAQLSLLAVVVLWLVLMAVTEQRRPEVALARLRGRGRRGAGLLLLGELLPVVIAGVLPGAAVAVAGAWWARVALLPGHAPLELGAGFFLAVALAALVLTALTVMSVLRVSREPVDTLLRRVPVRRSGWALGVADALVVAAAGAGFAAFVAGGLHGSAALAAPALLAVVVGLLLAHAATPVGSLVGRGLLARGRLRGGLGVLEAARNPATRRTVAIVTLTAALAVFSADALAVGTRNRAFAAEQEAGADRVVEIEGNDLAGVRAALRAVDPDGTRVTPVVRIAPPGQRAGTMAVVPASFRRIGLFPGGRPPASAWTELHPPAAAPIRLTGDRVRLRVVRSDLRAVRPDGHRAPMTLSLLLLDGRGVTRGVPLAQPSTVRGHGRVVVDVPCARGCVLTGISVRTLPAASMAGRVTLADLSAGSHHVALGPASRWTALRERGVGSMTASSTTADRLTIRVRSSGSQQLTMTQAWIPPRVAALVVGGTPGGSDGEALSVTGLDGLRRDASRAGGLPRAPASPVGTSIVDLDAVQRGATVDQSASIEVWFADDDAATLAEVTRSLREHGVTVRNTYSLSDLRAPYDQSTAAWSLQLGALVGAAGLLLAVLVLVVLAVATWRHRSRDLAALSMSGLPRRSVRAVATLAQLPAIAVGVAAGAVVGLVGAHVALPIVPLFATAPEVSTLDLQTPWSVVLSAALTALVVLTLTGLWVGAAMSRQARLQRLRESL